MKVRSAVPVTAQLLWVAGDHVFAWHWFAPAVGRRGSAVLTASVGLAGISVTIH